MMDAIEANPEQTVFVFDLHDVLFTLDKQEAARAFFNSKQKAEFIKRVMAFAQRKMSICSPEDPMLCIEYVMLHTDGKLLDGALEMLNAHKLIPESAAVVRHLKEYKKFYCSNLGELSRDYLQSKNKSFFDFFIGGRVCCKKNNYVTKASPKAFTECKEMIEEKLGKSVKNIVFIDDNPKKLALAEQAGMIPVQFTSPKDLRELLAKFHQS